MRAITSSHLFMAPFPFLGVLEKWRVMPTTPPDRLNRLKAGWGSLAGSNLWGAEENLGHILKFFKSWNPRAFCNSKVKSRCRCFFQVLFYKFCPNLGTCFSWKLTNFFSSSVCMNPLICSHWSQKLGTIGCSDSGGFSTSRFIQRKGGFI